MIRRQFQFREQRAWSGYLLTGALIASLVFVVVTFSVLARHAWQEQEWIWLATEIQVTSQQLARSASGAAAGNHEAFLELDNALNKITAAANKLRFGSPTSVLDPTADENMITAMINKLHIGTARNDLPPTPDTVAPAMQQLSLTWHRMSRNATAILDHQQLVMDLVRARNLVQKNIPGIQENTNSFIRVLSQSGAPTRQIVFASRQLVAADRLLRRLSGVFQSDNAAGAATTLRKDVIQFEHVLKALTDGSQHLGIGALQNTRALRLLATISHQYEASKHSIEAILTSSSDLSGVRSAADKIILDSRAVLDQADDLKDAIAELPRTRLWPSQKSGAIGVILMIAAIWMLVYSFLSAERRRAKVAARNSKRNQLAILNLLDEMRSLADGDLTVEATVTNEITGAIAAAINYAIEQLRELVKGIKFTAQEVASSAMGTRASTSELAKASALQATQIGEASRTVQTMAQTFDSMVKRARESSDVARRSVGIAHNGGEKVRETINGMDTIREQIQQTSKRIKRLGESSQEIGDIVELINGIAEQTNVLALNAAIQAASAGGAGKGFAIVADEVQQLAESATHATRRIEILVQTIQADTAEAVVSMESTTSEVVSGARLAEDAGKALEQIELVSTDLSGLIDSISAEAHAQSDSATRTADLMKNVQTVSVQASRSSALVAESVNNLAELVMQLSNSVTDFKLPEDD